MRMRPALRRRAALFGTTCAALMAASSAVAASQPVSQVNLITDNQAFLASLGYTPAATEDPSLLNP